jgi:hypothetical protein
VLLAGVFKSQLSLGAIFAAGGGFIVLSGLLPLLGYLFFLARDLERRDRIPV